MGMKMSHKLLSSNGEVRSVTAEEVGGLISVDPSDPVAALEKLAALSEEVVALLDIPSSADGRAFSLIGSLAAQKEKMCAKIWVGGDLLPDQVTLAFQCGAAAVLVDGANWQSRGEADWLAVLKPMVGAGYRSTLWPEVSGISAMRS